MTHRSLRALTCCVVLHSAVAAAQPNPGTLLPPTDPILVPSSINPDAIEFSTTSAGACGLVVASGNGNTFDIFPPAPDPFGSMSINPTGFTPVPFTIPSGGSANTIFIGTSFLQAGTPCGPPFNQVSRWFGREGSDSGVARADAAGRVASIFVMAEQMPNPTPAKMSECGAVSTGNANGPGDWPWFRRTADCTGNFDINLVLRGVNVIAQATAPTHAGTTLTGCLSYNHGGDGQTAYSDPFARAPDGSQIVWLSANSVGSRLVWSAQAGRCA